MSGKETVLIVDDDPTTIMLIKHYLEGISVATLVAPNGPSALEILHTHSDQIGLVFLDIAMPHMNGYQLCEAIRADSALASLPVVAVTARSSPDMDAEARSVGINEVIPKPFKPSVIRDALERHGLVAPE